MFKRIIPGGLFTDIRFWLAVFFLVRIFGLFNPPLEIAHNWRQTTVTMVARNFYEQGADLMYPRIDIAGEKTGITGMEFPFFNYLIYLVSIIFGYAHWYGRLINLVVSTVGLFYFYKIIAMMFNKKLAFDSTLFLAVSLWFVYSRKIMPDTFSVSLVLVGLFHGLKYLYQKPAWTNLLLYFLLCGTGILSKVPAAVLLCVFAFPLIDRDIEVRPKTLFVLASCLFMIPFAWWYFYWVPFLVEEFHFWHFFMGGSMKVGFFEIVGNWNLALNNFYNCATGYSGFAIFLAGLFMVCKMKERKLGYVFSLILCFFVLFMFKAGNTFYRHSYYIIAFVPAMALVMGFLTTNIKRRWISVTLFVIVFGEMMAVNFQDFRIKSKNRNILDLEQILQEHSAPVDLIAINSDATPTPMYFAHRKGWVETNEFLSNEANLDSLSKLGCKYVVILKKSFGSDLTLNKTLLFENEAMKLYALPRE